MWSTASRPPGAHPILTNAYRTQCQLKWPDLWDAFRKEFDLLLTEAYEKDYCKHGLVKEFIVGFKKEVLLFIEDADLAELWSTYLKD